ncbi:MAG: Rossmann fold domain-containing protein [Pseudomonadota bacterium]
MAGQHIDWEAQRELPDSGLSAHAFLIEQLLPDIRAAIEADGLASLTVILPVAPSEHDAWRRALAGDLAREYAPKRVNIAAGERGKPLDTLCSFLRDAPGVTGHYVQAHD